MEPPSTYPMVAPDYAEHRSSLAKKTGLGRRGYGSAPVEAAPVQQVAEGVSGAKRGRKPATAAQPSRWRGPRAPSTRHECPDIRLTVLAGRPAPPPRSLKPGIYRVAERSTLECTSGPKTPGDTSGRRPRLGANSCSAGRGALVRAAPLKRGRNWMRLSVQALFIEGRPPLGRHANEVTPLWRCSQSGTPIGDGYPVGMDTGASRPD